MLRRGDIFFTRGTGLISKLIRYFSSNGGKKIAKVNHVGIFIEDGNFKTANVIEALFYSHIKRHTIWDKYGSNNDLIAVFRPTRLSESSIDKIVNKALSYIGRDYGYIKILAHFGDWCLFGRYFFRKFAAIDKYPICSWLVAAAYKEVNEDFGCSVEEAQPDDMWDYVNNHPEKYELIWPLSRPQIGDLK